MRRIVTLLLVLGLVLSLAAAGVMAAKTGPTADRVPDSAGEGQYCNAGSGNGKEVPAQNNPDQVECDPGNSPDNNANNPREDESTRPNPPPKK